MIRVVIFGTRTFSDYSLLKRKVDFYLQNITEEIVIVSGCAKGADQLGERYATEKGYSIEKYPADWDKYGKRAGMIRNEQMAQVATYAIGFWDGKSRGTKGMMNICEQENVPLRVVKY